MTNIPTDPPRDGPPETPQPPARPESGPSVDFSAVLRMDQFDLGQKLVQMRQADETLNHVMSAAAARGKNPIDVLLVATITQSLRLMDIRSIAETELAIRRAQQDKKP
jgi:hypothetical protein